MFHQFHTLFAATRLACSPSVFSSFVLAAVLFVLCCCVCVSLFVLLRGCGTLLVRGAGSVADRLSTARPH